MTKLIAPVADLMILRLGEVPPKLIEKVKNGKTLTARMNALREARRIGERERNPAVIGACDKIEFQLSHVTGWLIDPKVNEVRSVPVKVTPYMSCHPQRELGLSPNEGVQDTVGLSESVALGYGDCFYAPHVAQEADPAFVLAGNVWFGSCLIVGTTTGHGYAKLRPRLPLDLLQTRVRFLTNAEALEQFRKRPPMTIVTTKNWSDMLHAVEQQRSQRQQAVKDLYMPEKGCV